MKRAMLCAAVGTTFLMGAMTAARAEDGQMRVDLAGLNLDTVAGAHDALARINYSAGVFCDDVPGRQTLDHRAEVQACVAQMTYKSAAALHSPTVTALLEGRTPTAATPTVAVAQK